MWLHGDLSPGSACVFSGDELAVANLVDDFFKPGGFVVFLALEWGVLFVGLGLVLLIEARGNLLGVIGFGGERLVGSELVVAFRSIDGVGEMRIRVYGLIDWHDGLDAVRVRDVSRADYLLSSCWIRASSAEGSSLSS